MAKMNFKQVGKNIGKDAVSVGLTAAGMIAGQRFLSAKKLNMKPDGFVAQNEGFIKLGLGLVGMGLVKNPMLKSFMAGIAVQGGLQAASKMLGGSGNAGVSGVGQGATYQFRTMGNEQPMATQAQLNSGLAGWQNPVDRAFLGAADHAGNGRAIMNYSNIPMAVGAF